MTTCTINEEVGLTENTYYFDANGKLDKEPDDGKCIKIVTGLRDSDTGKVLVKWWNTLDGTPAFRCKFLEYDVDSKIYTPVDPNAKDHYVITWNGNGGTPDSQQTAVVCGEALVAIPSITTTEENMEFVGWYNALYGGSQIDTSTIPTDDTTYFARWRSTNLTLTFNFNHRDDGNEIPNQIVTLKNGESLTTLPSHTFTQYHDKQILIGWQSQNSSDSFSPISVPYTPTQDEVFDAIWSYGYLELKISKVYNGKRYVVPVTHSYGGTTDYVYCNQDGIESTDSQIETNHRTTDVPDGTGTIDGSKLLFNKDYKIFVKGDYNSWTIDMSALPTDSDTFYYYNEYEQLDSSKIASYIPRYNITWKFSHATPSSIVVSTPETDDFAMSRPTHKLIYSGSYGIYGWDKSSNETSFGLRDYHPEKDEAINALWFTGSLTITYDISTSKAHVSGNPSHYLHVIYTTAKNEDKEETYISSSSSDTEANSKIVYGTRITSFSWGDYGTGKDVNIVLPSSGTLTVTYNENGTYSTS